MSSNTLKARAMYYLGSEELISEIEKFPYLYDPKSEQYQNRPLKLETWTNISKKVFGGDEKWDPMSNEEKSKCVKIAQKRWKSLKDAFQRALKWEEERTQKGENLKRPYLYGKQMSFLIPIFYTRTARKLKEESLYATEGQEYDEYAAEDGEYSNEVGEYASADAVYGEDHYSDTQSADMLTPEVNIRVGDDELVTNPKRIKTENAVDNCDRLPIPPRLEYDADSMFLMSLIPTFRRIKPEDKVNAQIELLQVLKSYTCEPKT